MSVGGLLLAAGRSRRVGAGNHKLLAEFGGVPLVRRSAETVFRSKVTPVVVVTGHRCEEIEAALGDLPVTITYNKNYAAGIGTSLATGFGHMNFVGCDGVLVMLADMPEITTGHIDQLVMAFRSFDGDRVVRARSGNQPGHPLVIPAHLFPDMRRLRGDEGARALIRDKEIYSLDIGHAATKDLDTAKDIMSAGGALKA